MIPQKLVDKTLRDYAATKNARSVAKRTGLSLTTTYRILEANGVPREGLGIYRRQARKLPPDDQVLSEYQRGDSLSQIAERYHCTQLVVARSLKRSGAKMRPRGNHGKMLTKDEMKAMAAHYAELGSQMAVAALMGTSQSRVSLGLRKIGVYTSKDHIRGARHPSWKGGRYISGEGYVVVRIEHGDPLHCMARSNGYAAEHRIVMARALGRPLNKNESVHHINGDRTDNRIANLQLRFGKHGKGVVMTCAKCGCDDIKYREIATIK